MELFVAIVSNFANNFILCLKEVSGYSGSYHEPLAQCRFAASGDRKLLTSKSLLLFFIKELIVRLSDYLKPITHSVVNLS